MLGSLALFGAAAVAEISGVYLIWQGTRGGLGLLGTVAGGVLLTCYGLLAAQQSDHHFGRVLAAYGGIFVLGSLLWGVLADGFRPDRSDVVGAIVCVAGAGLMMYAPRAAG